MRRARYFSRHCIKQRRISLFPYRTPMRIKTYAFDGRAVNPMLDSESRRSTWEPIALGSAPVMACASQTDASKCTHRGYSPPPNTIRSAQMPSRLYVTVLCPGSYGCCQSGSIADGRSTQIERVGRMHGDTKRVLPMINAMPSRKLAPVD